MLVCLEKGVHLKDRVVRLASLLLCPVCVLAPAFAPLSEPPVKRFQMPTSWLRCQLGASIDMTPMICPPSGEMENSIFSPSRSKGHLTPLVDASSCLSSPLRPSSNASSPYQSKHIAPYNCPGHRCADPSHHCRTAASILSTTQANAMESG